MVVLRGSADSDDVRPLGRWPVHWSGPCHLGTSCPIRFGGIATSSTCCSGVVHSARWSRHQPAELLDGVVAILRELLARQAGVLVLEDVHRADPDGLIAIERIVRSGLRCTVVMTVRTDHELDDMVIDVIADAERHTRVERIALGPLSVFDVQQLLRSSVGIGATNVAADLHDRTGGHPLLLHQLLDTGAIGRSLDVALLPSSMGESVRRRVVRLDPATRSVLHAAAVIGSTCAFDTLLAVAQLDEKALIAALRRLCDERLLVELTPDVFSFVHALTRDVVVAGLLSRERRALHRRTLDALDDAAPPAVLLTHALGADDRARTLAAARAGASNALATGRVAMAHTMAAAGLAIAGDDLGLLMVQAKSSWQLRHVAEATTAARRVIELVGDDDPGRATECHRLLARIAWEAADPSVVRANVDGLLRQLDCANARERVGVLDALAEVTMLAADDRAVAWAEQSPRPTRHAATHRRRRSSTSALR